MNESDDKPVPGQIVRVIKGRDAGNYCVVVRVLDGRFIEVADGYRRKYDRAKKKNLTHVVPQPFISAEVQNSLNETGKVTNGKLRFAVSKFMNEIVSDLRKGESIDG
ncbi:KOW domain-containing RNA-binding protein [Tuberibacillus sp. Marseille-P3662]|uniref:KOW domain-containing RNA-binding protein n=1 Tax=Tuberibacillus sp. Marseille-P3662 TaxID=1965358 RepID=UPI000A1CB2F6|nr:KOW domain-containing RNA-binding protein [Tuberibacillus sp. Marseille-P3662]